MGGRGGAGGGIGVVRSAVERSEFWESAKSNAYLGAEKLLKSPTFVESVKEAIGKEAFMRNYDITQKQMDTLTNKMIRALTEKKTPKNNNREKSAEDYAKRYFREHYNPNREQREITSSTYKRAQNNLQGAVNSFFGRGMEKKKKRR
jgi:hypothetical protein